MPRKHASPGTPARPPGRPPGRPTAAAIGPALAACALLLLGGCEALYDDTKGWANRLEASILRSAHDLGEASADDTAAAEAAAAPAPGAEPASETPPAVPVAAVDTAALPALPATPATPATPASADQPAVTQQAPALSAPGGAMAAAAQELIAPPQTAEAPKDAKAAPAKAEEKMPPKPLPKPEMASRPAEAANPADAAVAMVLHLSSLRSEEAAKREWGDLQRSFPEPLGELQAAFQRTELGDKGTYYRVLAGPLPSRDAARRVCADLKAKNARQYCRVMPSPPQS